MKKGVWIGVVALIVIVFGMFLFSGDSDLEIDSDSLDGDLGDLESGSVESGGLDGGDLDQGTDWREISLEDVRTGESFKISDFSGKPVLLESFAVWCPTCTRQQREIGKLHEALGDSVISISLDTDPNEDKQRVLDHVQREGFDWRYVISPAKLTEGLIEEFGVGFVNAPSAPVALICESGVARKLPNGVKDVDELKEELEKGC